MDDGPEDGEEGWPSRGEPIHFTMELWNGWGTNVFGLVEDGRRQARQGVKSKCFLSQKTLNFALKTSILTLKTMKFRPCRRSGKDAPNGV